MLRMMRIYSVRKLQKNESGFGTLEVVLVVVIVAVIGTVGWLVYKNHHKATTAAVTTTAKTTTKPATITKTTTTTTTAPSNTVKLDNGAVVFTVPTGWSGVVDSPAECRASVGSPVTEDNDCIASAEATLSSSAQAANPLTATVSVYTLKDLSATPQSWFENDMQETQAVPAEGDITSHDTINEQPSPPSPLT
jgi:hypothetical protein